MPKAFNLSCASCGANLEVDPGAAGRARQTEKGKIE